MGENYQKNQKRPAIEFWRDGIPYKHDTNLQKFKHN